MTADFRIYYVTGRNVTDYEPAPGYYVGQDDADPVGPFDSRSDAERYVEAE